MGAAAFVMAEFLAVPYFQVTLWAIIPAILYYVAVFFAVHFEAKRLRPARRAKSGAAAAGHGDARARASVHPDPDRLRRPDHAGYSAPLCALVAALACLPMALLRKTTREGITWRTRVSTRWRKAQEYARGRDRLRVRRHRHRLDDDHRPGHQFHADSSWRSRRTCCRSR